MKARKHPELHALNGNTELVMVSGFNGWSGSDKIIKLTKSDKMEGGQWFEAALDVPSMVIYARAPLLAKYH